MKILAYIIIFLVIAAGMVYAIKPEIFSPAESPAATDYEEQIAAMSDLIRVTSPKPNDEIISPLVITGEARGTYFFEASFPVIIVDWDGRIIATHYAEAQSDWMTTEFVPFKATIEFEKPLDTHSAAKRGAIILQKDNPSGLPEHDAAVEIPIRFK